MAIQRYGMAVRLKDEKRQYYIDNHANVWPEVLEELKKINVQNYSCFNPFPNNDDNESWVMMDQIFFME